MSRRAPAPRTAVALHPASFAANTSTWARAPPSLGGAGTAPTLYVAQRAAFWTLARRTSRLCPATGSATELVRRLGTVARGKSQRYGMYRATAIAVAARNSSAETAMVAR